MSDAMFQASIMIKIVRLLPCRVSRSVSELERKCTYVYVATIEL